MNTKTMVASFLLGGLSIAALPACTDSSTTGSRSGDGACTYRAASSSAKEVSPPSTSDVARNGTVDYVVALGQGEVTLTLDRATAPCTVHSFESLAAQGYFDDTSCHRLTTQGIFVLQCGDPSGTGSGGPGYEFDNETDGSESYQPGVVAMANAGPDTNGSQFILVYADSTTLDRRPNYTIFATMDAASRDLVAAIAAKGADGGSDGAPNEPVQIQSVTEKSRA